MSDSLSKLTQLGGRNELEPGKLLLTTPLRLPTQVWQHKCHVGATYLFVSPNGAIFCLQDLQFFGVELPHCCSGRLVSQHDDDVAFCSEEQKDTLRK